MHSPSVVHCHYLCCDDVANASNKALLENSFYVGFVGIMLGECSDTSICCIYSRKLQFRLCDTYCQIILLNTIHIQHTHTNHCQVRLAYYILIQEQEQIWHDNPISSQGWFILILVQLCKHTINEHMVIHGNKINEKCWH